ncbi:hypothetical protein FCV25MIE_34069 [Fagus crenata]
MSSSTSTATSRIRQPLICLWKADLNQGKLWEKEKLGTELVVGTENPNLNLLLLSITVLNCLHNRTGDTGNQENRVEIQVHVRGPLFPQKLQLQLHRLHDFLQQHRHTQSKLPFPF